MRAYRRLRALGWSRSGAAGYVLGEGVVRAHLTADVLEGIEGRND